MPRNRLVIAALAVALVAGVADPAGASPVGDKQRQAQQIADRIERLGDEAASLGEAYNGARLEMQQADAAVADAERRLADLDTELATMRSALSQFALKVYMYADQTSGLAATLAGTSVADGSAQRAGYTQVAMGASTTATDDLKALMEDADNERRQLEQRRAAKAKAADALAARKKAAEATAKQQQELLTKVKGELATLVAQERERRREEAAQLAAAQLPKVDAALTAAQTRPSTASSAAATTATTAAAATGPGAAAVPASPATTAKAARATLAKAAPPTTAKPAPQVDVPSTSPGAAVAVRAALSQLGVPYVFNAAEPGVAFDCSGLTMWAWAQAGVSMAHYTVTQWNSFPHVPLDALQPGDLIFSYSLGHVGMYIGNGMMVAAPRTGDVVKITPVFTSYRPLDGAVRPG
jgi:cell wall-associated NlpC family hydrolase